jgi:hypothetical protein
MAVIIAFHVLMFLAGLGVIFRAIPVKILSGMLGYVHSTIGITPPPLEQVRTIVLIWLGSTIVIVDGCLALLVFVARLLNQAG